MTGAITIGLDYAACAERLALCGLWDDDVASGLRVFEMELITFEGERRAEHEREAEDRHERSEWTRSHRPAGMRLIEKL